MAQGAAVSEATSTAMPATAEATKPETDSSADSKPAAPTVVDDAMSAAEGTRTTAKWIASSLGALPGLTVVASIVRAPGEAGFDSSELALGVFLAAGGALLGILAFANVLAPAAIEEKDLKKIDVKRLPGHPFSSYDSLAKSIETLWRLKGNKDVEVAAAKAEAAAAEAKSAGAESKVLELKSSLADADDEEEKKVITAQLKEARKSAAALTNLTTMRKAELARLTALAESLGEQLERREALRSNLYRLAGADEVRRRYELAGGLSVFAVAAVAGGLILLGLAPKLDTNGAASLAVLKPTEEGKVALGCDAATISALKVGGDEDAPTVITFPSTACPNPKQLDFSKALGTIEAP